MRTTLTIDDDIAGVLKRRAATLDKPFKEILNAALRRGLASELIESSNQIPLKTRPHNFQTRPGIDWNRLNQLSDELEVEAFIQKQNSTHRSG